MPDDLRIIRGLLARNYPGTSVDRERQAAAFRAGMEKAAHVVSGIVDGSTYEDAEAKIVFAIAAHDVAVREGEVNVTWNHRVIRTILDGQVFYGIHEVYYDTDGKVTNWTANPVAPVSETRLGLRQEIERFLAAADLPVIEMRGLGGHKAKRKSRAAVAKRGTGDGAKQD